MIPIVIWLQLGTYNKFKSFITNILLIYLIYYFDNKIMLDFIIVI